MAKEFDPEITIKYPDEDVTPTLTTLTMRPPKVKNQLTAAKVHADSEPREVLLISMLCGVTFDQIQNLQSYDYQQCAEKLNDYFEGKHLPTSVSAKSEAE